MRGRRGGKGREGGCVLCKVSHYTGVSGLIRLSYSESSISMAEKGGEGKVGEGGHPESGRGQLSVCSLSLRGRLVDRGMWERAKERMIWGEER